MHPSDIPSDEPLMRPMDVLTYCGISSSYLHRLGDQGRIKSIRTIGGHRRYRLKDVQALKAYLDELKANGGPRRGRPPKINSRPMETEPIGPASWLVYPAGKPPKMDKK